MTTALPSGCCKMYLNFTTTAFFALYQRGLIVEDQLYFSECSVELIKGESCTANHLPQAVFSI